MRILHVVDSLGFGGTETWLLGVALTNGGKYQIDFLLTSGEKSKLDGEFEKSGCNLYYIKFSKRRLCDFIYRINNLVRDNKYDVIHNHGDFISGWHWLFLLPNLPKIRISHAHNGRIYINNYLTGFRRKLFYKIGKFFVGFFSTAITGTSNNLLNDLGYKGLFYSRKRIEPLYCGVDVSLFRFNMEQRDGYRKLFGIKNDEKVVLFVGRIDCPRENDFNHKNPAFAIEIAKKVCIEDKKVKFLFIGDKGNLGELEEGKIKDLGLQDQIFFLGLRHDVNLLMNAADLFILTSSFEPFGLVLVEAQLMGLKILSSDSITSEIMEFEELFCLLSLNDGGIWMDQIKKNELDITRRLDFLERNKEKIKSSKFSITTSFDRLVKYYKTAL